MLFHTLAFAIFLVVVLGLSFNLPRRWMLPMLVVASYIFYGWAYPQYVLLMLGSSVVDYGVARHFLRYPLGSSERRRGIWISAFFNFGLLAFFKYTNFGLENVQALAQWLGWTISPIFLRVALPVGISFYTFHSFSYAFDVLTGKAEPCRSLPRFLLFVAWFPQLVAGPIARTHTLLPDLETVEDKIPGAYHRLPEAVLLFAEGWLRKTGADWLSLRSEAFFSSPETATTAGALYGILAFGLQIYADFSGYTRMAQGVSWLFGVRLAENFDLPYLATSPQDFWRRWHISLSSWFRDYVYIPLGGNRDGKAQACRNILLTMLLSGLWHGASWNFVLWGAMHGALLVLQILMPGLWAALPRIISIPLMWVLVLLAWVPFRAPDFASMVQCYRAIGHGGLPGPVPTELWAGLLLIIACDAVTRELSLGRSIIANTEQGSFWRRPDLRASLAVAICLLIWLTNAVLWQVRDFPFIYFNF